MNATSVIAPIFCSNRNRKPQTLPSMSREEIEQKMDKLARDRDTHDPEIREEIFKLARRLKEMEH
jgi:hypothetical protein